VNKESFYRPVIAFLLGNSMVKILLSDFSFACSFWWCDYEIAMLKKYLL